MKDDDVKLEQLASDLVRRNGRRAIGIILKRGLEAESQNDLVTCDAMCSALRAAYTNLDRIKTVQVNEADLLPHETSHRIEAEDRHKL